MFGEVAPFLLIPVVDACHDVTHRAAVALFDAGPSNHSVLGPHVLAAVVVVVVATTIAERQDDLVVARSGEVPDEFGVD